jgi:hypothetical protein
MAVTALEIKTGSLFASGKAFGDVGAYQQLEGTVHFAVDPHHPGNAGITDLTRPAGRAGPGAVLGRCAYPRARGAAIRQPPAAAGYRQPGQLHGADEFEQCGGPHRPWQWFF